MAIFKNSILLIFVFFLSSCGDLDLGMKYQKKLLTQESKQQIFCYHFAWALDAEASYISTNAELCNGFDSTKDFCFVGPATIYYENKSDTLEIYTLYAPPTPPKFSGKIKIVSGAEYLKYENEFTKGNIKQIVVDSLINVPCTPIPYINRRNMKFEKK